MSGAFPCPPGIPRATAPLGAGLKLIGSQPMPVAAFAGPGGKHNDRVYVVDAAGNVTVLALK